MDGAGTGGHVATEIRTLVAKRFVDRYTSLTLASPRYTALLADVCECLDSRAQRLAWRILEVCCGPGTLSVELLRMGHWCVSLDPDPFMIAKAGERAGRAPNADFRVDPLAAPLPFDDEEFDAVVLPAGVLEVLPDPGGLLREAERLVVDRGTLIVLGSQTAESDLPSSALATTRALARGLDALGTPAELPFSASDRVQMLLDTYGFEVETIVPQREVPRASTDTGPTERADIA